jgi:hypothetical protein
MCDVPIQFGKGLFTYEGPSCRLRRQPGTKDEMNAMIQVLSNQEFGCIRYAGHDAALLKRFGEAGVALSCDDPRASEHEPQFLTHALVTAQEAPSSLDVGQFARRVVDEAVRILSGPHFDVGRLPDERGVLRLRFAWMKVVVVIAVAPAPAHGPAVGLELEGTPWDAYVQLAMDIDEGLKALPWIQSVRWSTRGDWEAGRPSGRETPY